MFDYLKRKIHIIILTIFFFGGIALILCAIYFMKNDIKTTGIFFGAIITVLSFACCVSTKIDTHNANRVVVFSV
jgi:hypothetical protein